MKYIKAFEAIIKHNDPIAINHKLRKIAFELKDIFKNTSTRITFSNTGSITISCSNIFKITLKIIDRFQWRYTTEKNEWINIDFDLIGDVHDIVKLEFFKILKLNLKDYIRRDEDFNKEKKYYIFYISFLYPN